jgi:hypothetical protein
MERPTAEACKLRPELVNLNLDTQLAMIRACHEADIGLLIETETRRKTLTEHIRKCGPPRL